MQWSKTKKQLESFLCNKLQGRIHVHAAVYRKFHDSPGRVWITFDKEEIVSAADVTYMINHGKVYQELKQGRKLEPIPTDTDLLGMMKSTEREDLWKASDDSDDELNRQGLFSTYQLYQSFLGYTSLSIEEALTSENPVIQAFAMFDRRLGKRKLKTLNITKNMHPLIDEFYQIRCMVEGLEIRSGNH
ncbi:nonribosomal peptide synthetase [Fredinandcohnia sp. 179-A 10B2 NHS]|uniref:SF0329 family protein n=1 Tax=Fredinandcohnia sp. 179-A 10B2 NHS TaxID=3235176 RepID=UPI0039A3F415